MATETFVIQIVERGAAQTASAIDNVGKASEKSASALRFFRQALVALAAVRAVQGFVEFADAAARIDNRLRNATKSTDEFNRAQEFLRQLSRGTRTDLEANAVIYSRLLRATEGLKFTTNDLEKAQSALSTAIKVGGATSQEAKNALIQFSQALGSGALRGDELRSVSEQLPAIANAIGKEFGVAGGQLIAFAKANPGILQTEKVVQGLIKALPELQRQATLLTPTMTEGFQVIKNSIIEMLQDVNRSVSVFGFLNRVLVFVADNLRLITELLLVFGAAWASAKIIQGISYIAQATSVTLALVRVLGIATIAQWAWNAAVAANPYVAVVGAIVLLIGTLLILYNHLEFLQVAVYVLGQGFNMLWTWAAQLATTIGAYLAPAFAMVSNAFTTLVPYGQALLTVFSQIATAVGQFLAPVIDILSQYFQILGPYLAYLLPVVQLLATAFGVTLYTAFFVVLSALTVLIQALDLLGLVSDESAQKVYNAYAAYIQLAPAVIGLTEVTKLSTAEDMKKSAVIDDLVVNYRKLSDAATRSGAATKKGTEIDIDAIVAKRALNKEIKEEVKWREMATGRTQAGWAAYDKLNGVQRTNVSVTREGVTSINSLSDAMGMAGSQALSTAGSVASLSGSISSSASAANAAAAAYSSMASAASSAGSAARGASGAGIMDSSFVNRSGSSGQAMFSIYRDGTAAEKAVAQQTQSLAQSLYTSGKISLAQFTQAMNDAQKVLSDKIPISYYGKTVGSGAAWDPAKLVTLNNQFQEKINNQSIKDTLASAAAAGTSAQNFQTFWPWQTAVGFDTGGSFKVPGNRGDTDTKMAALKLSPGEEVKIRAAGKGPDQGSDYNEGDINIVMHLYGVTDHDSLRRNQAQIESDFGNAVRRDTKRRRK